MGGGACTKAERRPAHLLPVGPGYRHRRWTHRAPLRPPAPHARSAAVPRTRGRREVLGEGRNWSVALTVEFDRKRQPPPPGTHVGVGLGVGTLATVGTRTVPVSPDGAVAGSVLLRMAPPSTYAGPQRRLRRLSKDVSRKMRGSSNRRKAIARLRKHHARLVNLRHDVLHKLTTGIVRRSANVGIEHPASVPGGEGTSRAIAAMGFYEFRRQLEYKAAEAGVEIAVADKSVAAVKTVRRLRRAESDSGEAMAPRPALDVRLLRNGTRPRLERGVQSRPGVSRRRGGRAGAAGPVKPVDGRGCRHRAGAPERSRHPPIAGNPHAGTWTSGQPDSVAVCWSLQVCAVAGADRFTLRAAVRRGVLWPGRSWTHGIEARRMSGTEMGCDCQPPRRGQRERAGNRKSCDCARKQARLPPQQPSIDATGNTMSTRMLRVDPCGV